MISRNNLTALTYTLSFLLLPAMSGESQSARGNAILNPYGSGAVPQLPIPPHPGYKNTRVNQDQNIYPKSVAGATIDPTDGRNLVVLDNDNRLGDLFLHDFYHVTSDDGIYWTDGIGPGATVDFSSYDSGLALSQSSKGIAFDSFGHTFTAVAVLNGRDYADESSVAVSTGVQHGAYSTGLTVIDTNVCGINVCHGDTESGDVPNTQGVSVDNSATATSGSIYVFYSVVCSAYATSCEGTIAPGAAVMKVAVSPGYGKPFAAPQIWSQPIAAGQSLYGSEAGAGSMAVDIHGTAYLFFSDTTHLPKTDLWQSTNGTTKAAPFVEFVDAGLNNPKWKFMEDKQFQCAEYNGTGYCAFAATQVGTATAAATPSIFMAAINLADGRAKLSRVNSDSFTGGKDHFNPSVAITPGGDIYVGWFDNRKDPSNVKVDYFVGKSVDGGKTFPGQHAVNDVSFDPTIGVVGPSGAMVAKPQGGVKAFWADTRDGATQQIWSEDVR